MLQQHPKLFLLSDIAVADQHIIHNSINSVKSDDTAAAEDGALQSLDFLCFYVSIHSCFHS